MRSGPLKQRWNARWPRPSFQFSLGVPSELEVEVEMEVVGVLGEALLTRELVVVGVGSVGSDEWCGCSRSAQFIQLHGSDTAGSPTVRSVIMLRDTRSSGCTRLPHNNEGLDEPLGVVGPNSSMRRGRSTLGVVHAAEAFDAQLFHQSRGAGAAQTQGPRCRSRGRVSGRCRRRCSRPVRRYRQPAGQHIVAGQDAAAASSIA